MKKRGKIKLKKVKKHYKYRGFSFFNKFSYAIIIRLKILNWIWNFEGK